MALSNAEKKAAQRERAKAAGICIVCFVRNAEAGLTVCQTCNNDAKERVRQSRAAKKKGSKKQRKRKP